jgi:subtilisin family serine protease
MIVSRIVTSLVLVAMMFTTIFNRPANAANRDIVPDQYIVVFNDSVHNASDKARNLAAQHGLTLKFTYEHAFKGFAAVIPPARLAQLQADPNVASVSPDQVVKISTQTVPTGINRTDAELSPTARINGVDERVNVDVAVIDTGIDIDHPDLNVVGGKNCTLGLSYDDDHGHGSHVGGTIAAKDNSVGVVGVAPGARLWAVKVLNALGVGTTSQIVCGIDWVAANSGTIEVANMSLGGSGGDDGNCGKTDGDTEHRAICNAVAKGVTFAVAAGNDSVDAKEFAPAAYDEVITVSALSDFNGLPGGGAASTCRADEDDTLANFSNYGADVDIIAPGVCIYSTWMNGGYNTISGTSMASPHVAGAAALYKAKNPSATPSAVRQALINAGTTDWDNRDDRDGIKERLLNVKSF